MAFLLLWIFLLYGKQNQDGQILIVGMIAAKAAKRATIILPLYTKGKLLQKQRRGTVSLYHNYMRSTDE